MNKNTKFELDLYEALNLHLQGKPSVQKYIDLLWQEPDNSLLLYLTASVYNRNGDNKNALKFYKKAAALNSNIDFSNKFFD